MSSDTNVKKYQINVKPTTQYGWGTSTTFYRAKVDGISFVGDSEAQAINKAEDYIRTKKKK